MTEQRTPSPAGTAVEGLPSARALELAATPGLPLLPPRVGCVLLEQQARQPARAWLSGVGHARPLVPWTCGASLDGRSAARP